MTAGAAFEAIAVSRRYGHVTALDHVDLVVPEGAFMLLIGANGAGKTTLLHLFLHLAEPSAGEVRVFGRDATDEATGVRAELGYIAEAVEWPFPRMRLRGLLDYHAAYRPSWDHLYAGRLASALDLQLDRRVAGLSKGELRRAQVVTALAHRPRAILLDEMTDGLDPLVRRRVLEMLSEHLSEHQTTVIASTHQVHEMEGFADQIALMHSGRMVGTFTRDMLQQEVCELVVRRPAAWVEPTGWPGRVLQREARGLEERWTVLGPVPEFASVIARSGGEVAGVHALSIEEAAIALLTDAAAAPASASGSREAA